MADHGEGRRTDIFLVSAAWKVNVRHHSSCAPAADSFENRQRRFNNMSKFLDRVPLFGPQRQTRRGRNNENASPFPCLDLKHIPGELLELLEIDGNDIPSRRLDAIQNMLAFVRIRNGVDAA